MYARILSNLRITKPYTINHVDPTLLGKGATNGVKMSVVGERESQKATKDGESSEEEGQIMDDDEEDEQPTVDVRYGVL